MIKIKILTSESRRVLETETGLTLLDILRKNGYSVYAPCGGKGTCGKCIVSIAGEGNIISCTYYPDKNIEVILPGQNEANILTGQTELLEDIPFEYSHIKHISPRPHGVAIDIGTTTIVLYFMDLLSGQIERISSLLNPQNIYGSDVISRINYCREHADGLSVLQRSVMEAVNNELHQFSMRQKINAEDFEKIVIVGNTTMLHILLGEDPFSIAVAPFTPKFTDKQMKKGISTGLNINDDGSLETLPCISAYIGADIVAGLAALKRIHRNYLFLDIGTNGEAALIRNGKIFSCATAAGPAFEGANITCGMGAVDGAISGFTGQTEYQVIGNTDPLGICGSGIVDIVAYLIQKDLIEETGLLKETFTVIPDRKIQITQQDIREIQLAKSAIYSGIKVLMNKVGLTFQDIDALYLAGGFGNYINIESAIQIGLLPYELQSKTYPVGNSAGIGALQYLKSDHFKKRIDEILEKTQYIELSNSNEFTTEFALNMDFKKHYL
jgi:uncharacterized 2Fe-2S/4Fe-4S cluster protein (DUF4445 family)